MNISHVSLINKMEQELLKAKKAERPQNIREHINSIKALCEVMLENESVSSSQPVFSNQMPAQQMTMPVSSQQSQTVTITEESKLETEDGANGDSLFEF
ncbi:YwdI family protein [Bacillus sp. SCS-153A]|uniref:YwdI family protein n=1 Tax=Rossellomorea sedimentorum TaxID=3115294 RepID=UPI003905A14E